MAVSTPVTLGFNEKCLKRAYGTMWSVSVTEVGIFDSARAQYCNGRFASSPTRLISAMASISHLPPRLPKLSPGAKSVSVCLSTGGFEISRDFPKKYIKNCNSPLKRVEKKMILNFLKTLFFTGFFSYLWSLFFFTDYFFFFHIVF